eukprot:gene9414-19533_t
MSMYLSRNETGVNGVLDCLLSKFTIFVDPIGSNGADFNIAFNLLTLFDFKFNFQPVDSPVLKNACYMSFDHWFEHGSFETSKLAIPIHYDTARQSGTITTLEGEMKYEVGHKIITGPHGEKYPVTLTVFETFYIDNNDGTATPKKIMKFAKLADHDGVINTSMGDMEDKAGADYIVRHGPGHYGPVKKEIFNKTYETMKELIAEDLQIINKIYEDSLLLTPNKKLSTLKI